MQRAHVASIYLPPPALASAQQEDSHVPRNISGERRKGFDLHVDRLSTVVCAAGEAGLDSCELLPGPEMSAPPTIDARAFMGEAGTVVLLTTESEHALCEPREWMPNHASVTVRRAGEVLVAEAWAPDYDVCRREFCRRTYSSSHEIVVD